MNGTGGYASELKITPQILQANPQWKTIATNDAELRKPPVPVPFSMIKSLVESSVGNQLHHREDNKLSWGNTSGVNTVWGDHVEAERKDGNTLHFDLDLQYEITGINPEIDVDFDLVFICNGDGTIDISTQYVKVGCNIAGLTCSTVQTVINEVLRIFTLNHYTLDKPVTDGSMIGASFTLRPAGIKCKGVLVNADKSVFIY